MDCRSRGLTGGFGVPLPPQGGIRNIVVSGGDACGGVTVCDLQAGCNRDESASIGTEGGMMRCRRVTIVP